MIEERIQFTNVPEAYENVLLSLKGVLASQVQKLASIPDDLDEVVALLSTIEEGDDNTRTIQKTIEFELPDGWEKKFIREFKRAQRTGSNRGGLGFWSYVAIGALLLWLMLTIA